MSETKPTNGPWVWHEGGRLEGDGDWVLWPHSDCGCSSEIECEPANRQLIAAAPDLLGALISINSAMDCECPSVGCDGAEGPCVDCTLRAILYEATGDEAYAARTVGA